jgi:hypothetical protein
MSKLSGAYAAVRVSKLLESLTPHEKINVLSFCLECAEDEMSKTKIGITTGAQEFLELKEKSGEPA